MRRITQRTARALSCAVVAAALAAIPLAAAAADPTDHVSGGEGSVNDTQNITNAGLSDTLAPTSEVGFELDNLVGANVGTASGGRGCSGYTTKPAERANYNSPTYRDIFVTLHGECWGGYNGFEITVRIERSRWWGWQELASMTARDNGSNPWYYHRDLTTYCRAGTWSYRNRVSGGWGGRSGQFTTDSYRTTCHDRNDIGYIDVS